MLDLTPKAISFYELGAREPSGKVLINMAKILGTTTDYLLGYSDSKTTKKFCNTFSTQLKTYRKRNNYTQRYLADALGITQQAVAKWETNKASPDPEMLKKISKLFNVTIDNLLGGHSDIKKEKMHKDLNKFLEQSEIIFDGDTYNLEDTERQVVLKSLEVAFYAVTQKRKKDAHHEE